MKFKCKKFLTIFLTIALTLTTVVAFPITAHADYMDATGLDSGFEYYIKNTGTGKYLDVDHGVVENGRNILEFSFNGGTNQKWQIYRVASGEYKIVSSLNTDYGLDIKSGGNAILYKYKGSSNEKFNIIRTGSSTYNIKNDNKYVSVSNGNVQTMTSYPSGTWCFERVYRGEINMFSFNYSGYNSTTQNDLIHSNFDSMNYQYLGSYVNTSRGYAYDKLQMSHIWIHNGHGDPGIMKFTTDGSNFQFLSNSYINALDANALSTERVIITTGCKSAKNTGSSSISYRGNNLIEAMYDKGAHFSIGWQTDVNTAQGSQWIKQFFNSASVGNTVRESMYNANNNTNLSDPYYAGDTFQVLTR